jgi:predicted nucleotidyltransferase
MKDELRLSSEVQKKIFILTKEIFGGSSRVWIFGSRVRKDIRGGDIDIYIETEDFTNILEKRLDFLVNLKNAMGDQKIDLVVKKCGDKSLIAIEAKQNGVEITEEVMIYA